MAVKYTRFERARIIGARALQMGSAEEGRADEPKTNRSRYRRRFHASGLVLGSLSGRIFLVSLLVVSRQVGKRFALPFGVWLVARNRHRRRDFCPEGSGLPSADGGPFGGIMRRDGHPSGT